MISEHQFGFMKGIDTKNALNNITNILYNNLDKSKPTIVTFLDLAKAFDTVDHKILIDKLHCIGIRGRLWIYLQVILITDIKQSK